MDILINKFKEITLGLACALLLLITNPLMAEVRSSQMPDHLDQRISYYSSDAYEGLDIINLDEMNSMRGGFSFGGLELKFGAVLNTMIDNVKFETVFNISDMGAEVVSQVLQHLGIVNKAVEMMSNHTEVTSATEAEAMATIQKTPDSTFSEGTFNSTTAAADASAVLVGADSGASISDFAPVDFKLDGIDSANGFSGVVVNDHRGFTAALHRLTKNAAISAIISNASNLRVSQKLDIKIEVLNSRRASMSARSAKLSKLTGGLFRK